MTKSNNDSLGDFAKFWTHLPFTSQDETSIVLKGHLLVEDLMREFCASKMAKEGELEKARLSFSQITSLTKALQPYEALPWVWTAVDKINTLRNRLAHRLTPIDYQKLRSDFITFIQREANAAPGLFEAFSKNHEQIAVAIFVAHTALSVNLRFKPQGLIAQELLTSTPD